MVPAWLITLGQLVLTRYEKRGTISAEWHRATRVLRAVRRKAYTNHGQTMVKLFFPQLVGMLSKLSSRLGCASSRPILNTVSADIPLRFICEMRTF